MSAAKRRKRKFAFKTTHLFFLLAVFSISVAATTTVTSRMNQFALLKTADLICFPTLDYTTPCGQTNPTTKKIGGKDCPCTDETNGHKTPGKCQGSLTCKGEPPGGGKMPEMPKMPEPPKDSPPPPPPPPSTPKPCSPSDTDVSPSDTDAKNDFSGAQTRDEVTISGSEREDKPCPDTGPINGFLGGLLGGNTLPTTTSTTTPTTTPSRFSWTAITRVVQDVKNATNAVTNVVTGAVQNAITTLGGNQIRPVRPANVVNYSTTTNAGGSVAPKYFTSPDLNTFGAPQAPANTNSSSGGTGSMWDWLKGLMHIGQ